MRIGDTITPGGRVVAEVVVPAASKNTANGATPIKLAWDIGKRDGAGIPGGRAAARATPTATHTEPARHHESLSDAAARDLVGINVRGDVSHVSGTFLGFASLNPTFNLFFVFSRQNVTGNRTK